VVDLVGEKIFGGFGMVEVLGDLGCGGVVRSFGIAVSVPELELGIGIRNWNWELGPYRFWEWLR
jgi:hypothetical protein